MDWQDSVQELGSFRIKHTIAIDAAKELGFSSNRDFQGRRYCYHRLEILVAAYIASAWFLYDFCINYFSLPLDNIEAGGNQDWILATSVPLLIVSVGMLVGGALFTFDCCSDFCRRHYNTILSISLFGCFSAMLYVSEIQEIRRALFHSTPTSKYIYWDIDFSVFPPIRRCNDSSPAQTLMNRTDESPIGCNSLILNGTTFCLYIVVLLLPTSFRMDHGPCAAVVSVCCLLYLAALVSTGTTGLVMAFAVLFQVACGAFGSYLCYVRVGIVRDELAVEMSLAAASERNRALLHTLIPRGVMSRLAQHSGPELLSCVIPHCTIMFCALDHHDALQADLSYHDFAALGALVADLDSAVQQAGMFKYQHVGAWCAPDFGASPPRGRSAVLLQAPLPIKAS